jgi:hypothetical protein
MAGITLELAQAQLETYLAAEVAVLANQSYEIAGRKLTRADLYAIQAGVRAWDDRVKSLASRSQGRRRNRTIIYRG